MFALAFLLASVASSPAVASIPAIAHADATAARWETYAPNPAWELYGSEDANGVFRYTERRLKLPTINFGVNLAPKAAAAAPTVLGNDEATARLLMARPKGAAKSIAPAMKAAPCGHGDCPDGQCKRKPRPKPPVDVDVEVGVWPRHRFEPIHYALAAVAAVISLIVFLVFWGVVLVLCVLAYRLIRRALATPPPPAPPA